MPATIFAKEIWRHYYTTGFEALASWLVDHAGSLISAEFETGMSREISTALNPSAERRVSMERGCVTIRTLTGRAHMLRILNFRVFNLKITGSCTTSTPEPKAQSIQILNAAFLAPGWPVRGPCRILPGMFTLRSHVVLPQAVCARRWKGCLLPPAFCARGSETLAGTARINADVGCRYRAEASATLTEVQRKNQQLRVQLSKSPWPDLKFFSSKGQTYGLPLRAESRASSDLPSEATLAYLSGFFDGDGCVSCEAKASGCCLSIGQSFDQAEVLMLFYETFGGSIVLQSSGLGLRKPMLRWTACGAQSARNAAQLLAPRSMTKQRQLLLADQWPEAQSRREECKAELRALKEYDSAVPGPSSWEYCAGFFDAEGYIRQLRGGASLVLEIAQKHPQVLLCLRELFAQSLGKEPTVAKSRESLHALWVCGLASCKQILQHLLAAGLLCKVKQAELAVGLTCENASQVDAELGHLTGNQMFGKKLDASGRERAKKISAAQSQAAYLRKRGLLTEAFAKMSEVKVLREEHELLKARLENQQLAEYAGRLQDLHLNLWNGPFAQGM